MLECIATTYLDTKTIVNGGRVKEILIKQLYFKEQETYYFY